MQLVKNDDLKNFVSFFVLFSLMEFRRQDEKNTFVFPLLENVFCISLLFSEVDGRRREKESKSNFLPINFDLNYTFSCSCG